MHSSQLGPSRRRIILLDRLTTKTIAELRDRLLSEFGLKRIPEVGYGLHGGHDRHMDAIDEKSVYLAIDGYALSP